MRTVWRTGSLAAVALVLVAGACVHPDGRSAASSTTTTEPGEPESTTTTAGSDGAGDGEVAAGDECGEPPIWALRKAGTIDVADADDVASGATDDPGSTDSGATDDPGSTDSGATDDEPEPDEPGGSDECEPTTEPELGTGDVQVTLRWESDADLDLHVVEPNGEEIWYSEPGPTSTGGQLDVDSNVGCENDGSVENVFWPEGDMPLGEYSVKVVGFSVEGCGGGDYTLTASVQGQEVLHETGSVTEDEEDTYEFGA